MKYKKVPEIEYLRCKGCVYFTEDGLLCSDDVGPCDGFIYIEEAEDEK